MKNNTAFTLIELLVVVLIIGILAAVALPQYQKAMDKSGFVQIWTIAQAVGQAQEAYYLANGNYATSLDALDLDVSKYASRIQLRSCRSGNGIPDGVYVFHPRLNVFLYWAYRHQQCGSVTPNRKICYAGKDSKRANELCALMTNRPVRALSQNGTCDAGVFCTYGF